VGGREGGAKEGEWEVEGRGEGFPVLDGWEGIIGEEGRRMGFGGARGGRLPTNSNSEDSLDPPVPSLARAGPAEAIPEMEQDS